jgi:hypothetical protein
VHFDDFNTAIAHLGNEVEMILLSPLHPQYIVKQQIVAVAGGQTGVSQTWRTHHHFSQFAHF